MTSPAFEIEEPEPIEASHLLAVSCSRRCGARTVVAADQVSVALCGPCRAQDAASATCITRLPDKPPPAVAEWGSEKILAQNGAERVELVAPEFVCEPNGCDHPMPGPVSELRDVAILAHWKARVRHSRGGVMGGAGKQLAVAEIWSVRFRRGAWQGYAVRRDDGWDSVCVAGETLPPFMALGVADLRLWLAEPERGAEWYDGIRARVAASALSKKLIKCPGPGECEWVDAGRGDHTHRGDGAIKIKNSRAERKAGA